VPWLGSLDGDLHAAALVLGSVEELLSFPAQAQPFTPERGGDRSGVLGKLRTCRHELAGMVFNPSAKEIVRGLGYRPFRKIGACLAELLSEVSDLDTWLRAQLATKADSSVSDGDRLATLHQPIDLGNTLGDLSGPTAIALWKAVEDIFGNEVMHR
jgi:hypothetical protein